MISLAIVYSFLSASSAWAAEPCLIAGWRGVKTSSGCFSRGFADASQTCPMITARTAACNPQWFGTANGAGICAEKRADQRWTMSCLQKATTVARDGLHANLSRDFERFEHEAAALKQRVSRLEAERKEIGAGGSAGKIRSGLQAAYDDLSISRLHIATNRKRLEKMKRGLSRRSPESERDAVRELERSVAVHEKNLETARAAFVDRVLSRPAPTPAERNLWLERLRSSELTFIADEPKEQAARSRAEREMMTEPFVRELLRRREAANVKELAEAKAALNEVAKNREEADYWRGKLERADLSIDAILAGGPMVEQIRAYFLAELSRQGRRPSDEWTQLARTCEEVRKPQDKKDCAHVVKFLGGGKLSPVIADAPLPECRAPTDTGAPTLPNVLEDFAEAQAYEVRDLIQE
jgi:hypothetical protein